jgi:hypothetical protein
MVANLYFLNYNNYFNRQVRFLDTIADYQPYVIDVLQNVNLWNPGDGMMTEQVVNWDNEQNPNYVLAETTDGNFTRWFVIEAERTRAGQYKMSLKRDVVADNYEAILEAPMFIEKATPLSTSDPAIYNRENMDFNQIKVGETLLKDETGVPWVVGYIPRDAFTSDTEITADIPKDTSYDESVEVLSRDFKYYQYNSKQDYFGGDYKRDVEFVIQVQVGATPRSIVFCKYGLTNTNVTLAGNPSLSMSLVEYTTNKADVVNRYVPSRIDEMIAESYAYTSAHTESELQEFLSWKGKIIFETSTNTYWKVNIETDGVYDNPLITTISKVPSGDLFNIFAEGLVGTQISGTPDTNSFGIVSYLSHYYMTFEEIAVNAKVTIGDRAHLEDSPYDMFCIPYGELEISNGTEDKITTNPSIAIPIAVNIGAQSGSLNIYDIQLLPYCPIRSAIQEDGSFDIKFKSYDAITDQKGKVLSYLFWADSSNFTFNIPVTISGGTTIESRKIVNETQMCRLCSPNYSGVFEFSPAMNNGVNYVNVDATYKPFSPYIHINPDFKGLYGSDFNDSRGLILGGDFSLPQITNAWANFQLENKNFQAQFDREIQNLEVQREVQRVQQLVGIGTGALSGGSSGAIAGSLIGGPVGAAIGGIAGGLASIGGGIADYSLSEKLYNENIDFKKDMFGYQLGNIKALPSSLAKTSALTANNKLFPFVEYYSCTDEEVQALKDKLKYNGYSIGRIGKMIDYIQSEPSYIKGRVIRLEINDDYHAANEIKRELELGVYI